MNHKNIGRNDLCTCGSGKKYKHCCLNKAVNAQRKYFFLFLCLAALLGICGAAALWMGFSKPKEYEASQKSYLKTIHTFFLKKLEDFWWMRSPDEYFQDIPNAAKKFEEEKIKIERIIEKYADTSPLSREIKNAFPRLRTSLFVNNTSMAITREPEFPQGALEVCFMPQEDTQTHPNALYYRSDWRALMVSAIEWPEKFYPALIFHELGHALRHRQGKISSQAHPESDEFMQEEIEMHLLESHILDSASNGENTIFLKEILGRKKFRDFTELVNSVTLKDLERFEKLAGLEMAGKRVINVALGQLFLELILKHIELQLPPEEREKRYIEAYRWIQKNL